MMLSSPIFKDQPTRGWIFKLTWSGHNTMKGTAITTQKPRNTACAGKAPIGLTASARGAVALALGPAGLELGPEDLAPGLVGLARGAATSAGMATLAGTVIS